MCKRAKAERETFAHNAQKTASLNKSPELREWLEDHVRREKR